MCALFHPPKMGGLQWSMLKEVGYETQQFVSSLGHIYAVKSRNRSHSSRKTSRKEGIPECVKKGAFSPREPTKTLNLYISRRSRYNLPTTIFQARFASFKEGVFFHFSRWSWSDFAWIPMLVYRNSNDSAQNARRQLIEDIPLYKWTSQDLL